MTRPSTSRRLDVYMNGELVGHWTLASRARHQFRYAASWLESPAARPISLSMPLQPPDSSYSDERVEAFFDNLLPDSADIRRRIQMRFGSRSTGAFELLAEIGRDCVGAIQLVPPDAEPGNVQRIEGDALSQSEVADALRASVSAAPLGQRVDDAFRISLTGAQEKTAFLRHTGQWYRPRGATPSTHIFKLPLGRVGVQQLDLTTSVQNEWLCMQLLRAYGLPVADCELASFEGQSVLIVERFDRRLARSRDWWLRLPQEDFCQATGTPPGQKYEADGGPGIQTIMSLLLGARDAQADRRRFFKATVLFWLMAAVDGHAKNFSIFIEAGGRFSMTPFYDVISAYPVMGRGANRIATHDVRMAMAATGANRHYRWAEILPRHWVSTAKACNFESEVALVLKELIESTPDVLRKVAAEIPSVVADSVAEPILEGVASAVRRLRMP